MGWRKHCGAPEVLQRFSVAAPLLAATCAPICSQPLDCFNFGGDAALSSSDSISVLAGLNYQRNRRSNASVVAASGTGEIVAGLLKIRTPVADYSTLQPVGNGWNAVNVSALQTAVLNPKGTTLILDLDETLIHTVDRSEEQPRIELPTACDAEGVYIRLQPDGTALDMVLRSHDGSAVRAHTLLRPYLKEFLTKAFELFDNVVIFTAGSAKYGQALSAALLQLVPGYRFSLVLDRRYCLPPLDFETRTIASPVMVKDLAWLPNIDLSRTIMVDDHWEAVVQVENTYPIARFSSRGEHTTVCTDRELLKCARILETAVASLRRSSNFGVSEAGDGKMENVAGDVRKYLAGVTHASRLKHLKDLEGDFLKHLNGCSTRAAQRTWLNHVVESTQQPSAAELYGGSSDKYGMSVAHLDRVYRGMLAEMCVAHLQDEKLSALPLSCEPGFVARVDRTSQFSALQCIQRLRAEAYQRHTSTWALQRRLYSDLDTAPDTVGNARTREVAAHLLRGRVAQLPVVKWQVGQPSTHPDHPRPEMDKVHAAPDMHARPHHEPPTHDLHWHKVDGHPEGAAAAIQEHWLPSGQESGPQSLPPPLVPVHQQLLVEVVAS